MRCLACKSDRSRTFLRANRFGYEVCRSCRSLFIDPLPTSDELTAFYSHDYYGNCRPEIDMGGKTLTYGPLAERVADAAAGGNVLEVGAGTGFFMAALMERGALTFGVEFSPSAIELNPFAETGRLFPSLHQLPLDLRFKAAVYLDVIEHVVDLDQHLEQLSRRLEPGGLIFLVTPDRDSLSARLLGARWPHLSLPEHIVLFSRNGLATACERAGLQEVTIEPFRKRITLNYVTSILDRYSRIRVDYAVAKAVTKLIPPLGRLMVGIGSGHMLAIFRKPHIAAR
jgi:SAM-dependent methyltransferase